MAEKLMTVKLEAEPGMLHSVVATIYDDGDVVIYRDSDDEDDGAWMTARMFRKLALLYCSVFENSSG